MARDEITRSPGRPANDLGGSPRSSRFMISSAGRRPAGSTTLSGLRPRVRIAGVARGNLRRIVVIPGPVETIEVHEVAVDEGLLGRTQLDLGLALDPNGTAAHDADSVPSVDRKLPALERDRVGRLDFEPDAA